MSQTIYNKLVRDKIPELFRSDGDIPVVRVLDDKEYLLALINKLQEETIEFAASNSLEELADIQEVVLALCAAIGSSPDALEHARLAKARKKGAFNKQIYLEKVEKQS